MQLLPPSLPSQKYSVEKGKVEVVALQLPFIWFLLFEEETELVGSGLWRLDTEPFTSRLAT